MQAEKQRFWLTYQTRAATQPLLWTVSRKFDLVFNVRAAHVGNGLAFMAVEFEGPRLAINRAVGWFLRNGVRVEPVELSAIEG